MMRESTETPCHFRTVLVITIPYQDLRVMMDAAHDLSRARSNTMTLITDRSTKPEGFYLPTWVFVEHTCPIDLSRNRPDISNMQCYLDEGTTRYASPTMTLMIIPGYSPIQ